jgi:hypothetical protein
MTPPAPDYSALADVGAPFTPPPVAHLCDDDLIETSRVLAEIRRRADAASAAVAAEIAHRSRRELGYDGLAVKRGARTAEKLVQLVTGVSHREAQSLVRVGTMVASIETLDPDAPSAGEGPDPVFAGPIWLSAVGGAVTAGRLSIEAAEVIRSGLGTPSDTVSVAGLREAAETLLRDAATLTVERLAARARQLRDELDSAGVAEREAALRERRYLTLVPQSDGMTRISGLLDPESAAIVSAAFDGATSPRRGGPRFVDPEAAERAEDLIRDERTTEQVAIDAFVDLIRVGSQADPGSILPFRRPEVQVLVTDHDLAVRAGFGRIEGQTSAVSIETVERHVCEAGAIPIHFGDDRQVVNIGRSQRLYTQKQRVALAARDGGCRFPDCDRPPSFTEAHHINEWYRDGGTTDIAEGILLCRHHHLLIHNNGWRVTWSGGDYYVVPPRSRDPQQTPIPAPSKNPLLRRLVG